MTPREQVIVVLFGVFFGGVGILWALDLVSEKWDDYRARERVWQSIEIQSSRERHPSSRAQLFDQDEGRM